MKPARPSRRRRQLCRLWEEQRERLHRIGKRELEPLYPRERYFHALLTAGKRVNVHDYMLAPHLFMLEKNLPVEPGRLTVF